MFSLSKLQLLKFLYLRDPTYHPWATSAVVRPLTNIMVPLNMRQHVPLVRRNKPLPRRKPLTLLVDTGLMKSVWMACRQCHHQRYLVKHSLRMSCGRLRSKLWAVQSDWNPAVITAPQRPLRVAVHRPLLHALEREIQVMRAEAAAVEVDLTGLWKFCPMTKGKKKTCEVTLARTARPLVVGIA